jgi:hypothetical protein
MITFEQYLFRTHSRAELRAWAARLRYFRFCRAVGGHANDADYLGVALRHAGTPDAQRVFADLTDQPLQTGGAIIAGISVFLMLSPDALSLHLSGADGDYYAVTESDVANAEALEPLIAKLADRIIDPPLDDPRCIAPATHPDFWV